MLARIPLQTLRTAVGYRFRGYFHFGFLHCQGQVYMFFIVIINFFLFFFPFLLTPNQTLGLPLSGAFFAENENHSSLKNGFRCFYFPKVQVFSTIFLESRFKPKRWKTVFHSLYTGRSTVHCGRMV